METQETDMLVNFKEACRAAMEHTILKKEQYTLEILEVACSMVMAH